VTEELKPCPFCGAALDLYADESNADEMGIGAWYEVLCPNDDGAGDTVTHPLLYVAGRNREQTIKVANMRHAPPPVEAIEVVAQLPGFCTAVEYANALNIVREWLDSVGNGEEGEA
jgi:hypothetical protein